MSTLRWKSIYRGERDRLDESLPRRRAAVYDGTPAPTLDAMRAFALTGFRPAEPLVGERNFTNVFSPNARSLRLPAPRYAGSKLSHPASGSWRGRDLHENSGDISPSGVTRFIGRHQFLRRMNQERSASRELRHRHQVFPEGTSAWCTRGPTIRHRPAAVRVTLVATKATS